MREYKNITLSIEVELNYVGNDQFSKIQSKLNKSLGRGKGISFEDLDKFFKISKREHFVSEMEFGSLETEAKSLVSDEQIVKRSLVIKTKG